MTSRSFGPNTFNNWTPLDRAQLITWIEENCTRGIVGLEKAPTTGTPHLQFSFTTKKPMRKKAVEKAIKGAHIEISDNCDAAYNYCKMEDKDAWEFENKHQGKRTDLDRTYDAVESGVSIRDFTMTRPSLQSLNLFQKVRLITRESPKWRDLLVYSIYGPPGSGKSRFGNSFEGVYNVVPDKGAICWDSYDGQKIILMDEYRPTWTSFDSLLRILDGHPLEMKCRYFNNTAQWTVVIITSVEPLETMWAAHTEDLDQLRRRVTRTISVTDVTEVANVIIGKVSDFPATAETTGGTTASGGFLEQGAFGPLLLLPEP